MHWVKVLRPSPGIAAGDYLCTDISITQILAATGPGEIEISPASDHLIPWSRESICAATRLIVVRPAKYGDLILLTPCLREIKQLNPKAELLVACKDFYRDVLLNLPFVDGFVPYPIPKDALTDAMILNLEPLRQFAQRETEIHMTDLFAERLDLGEFANKKPVYGLVQSEFDWAMSKYPKTGKRISIQWSAGEPARSYPADLLKETLMLLYRDKWEIMILGLPGDVRGQEVDRVHFCCTQGYSFRESAAILATSDVFLGPDSSLLHVAGAMDIPAVGLYGAFPWKLRTAYSPSIFALQNPSGCQFAPCFHTSVRRQPFPDGGPCQKSGRCEAMAAISPDRILAKVRSLAPVPQPA